MKNIFCVLLVFACIPLIGQDSSRTDNGRIRYFFTFNSGMLAGNHGNSITYTASTVHGITWGKRLRVGAGVGFDSYQSWMAMPLFGQAHFDLDGDKNGIFLQMNYGWAHAWALKAEGAMSTSDHGGQMFNPMVGYRVASGKLKLYFAAGYKIQLTTSKYNYYNPVSSFYYSSGTVQQVDRSFRNIVFTLGVGLN